MIYNIANAKSYYRNSQFYDKNGRARGGFYTQKASENIYPKEDPNKEDKENRNEVVNIIANLINEQKMTLEAACEKIVSDESITSKFPYLNIENMAEIFANWYNGRIRERKPIEKGER